MRFTDLSVLTDRSNVPCIISDCLGDEMSWAGIRRPNGLGVVVDEGLNAFGVVVQFLSSRMMLVVRQGLYCHILMTDALPLPSLEQIVEYNMRHQHGHEYPIEQGLIATVYMPRDLTSMSFLVGCLAMIEGRPFALSAESLPPKDQIMRIGSQLGHKFEPLFPL